MDDAQLNRMSVKELESLKAEVEVAIRAAIRAKRAGAPQPGPEPASKKIDLEQERDAWLRARR